MSPPSAKTDIAVEYLEVAIRLYREGGAYFSCLHLAGAAEEIFGKTIEHNEKDLPPEQRIGNALTIAVDVECEMEKIIFGGNPKRENIRSRILYAKNSAKHFTDPMEKAVCVEPKVEAREMLLLAIHNYSCVFLEEEESIMDFEQELFREEESGIAVYGNS